MADFGTVARERKERFIAIGREWGRRREILRFAQNDGLGSEVEEAGFGDGGDGADGVEDGWGDLAVDADEGDGVGALVGGAAAEGEGGDVDAELAERGTDLADYTGFVFVAKIEDGAFELGFERDALDVEDAWGAVVEDGAFCGETVGGGG